MKKLLFLIIAAVLCIGMQGQSDEFLLDSIIHYDWDDTDSAWETGRIQVYEYDTAGNQTRSYMYYILSDTSWEGYYNEYYYDTSGIATGYKTYDWNLDSMAWIVDERIDYHYDTAGNRIRWTVYEWNSQMITWDSAYLRDFRYDSAGNEVEYKFAFREPHGVTWRYSYLRTSEYDSNGNLVRINNYDSDTTPGSWINTTMLNFTYNPDGSLSERIYAYWNGKSWEINSRYTYEYDEAGIRKRMRYFRWDAPLNDWVIISHYTYFHDSRGILIEDTRSYLQYSLFWQNTDRSRYVYYSKAGKHIAAGPTETDFGTLVTGDSSEWQELKIMNRGTDDLTVNTIEVPDSVFELTDLPDLPLILGEAESVALRVRFRALHPLNYSDSIVISSNSDVAANATIYLSGRGIGITPADSGNLYLTRSGTLGTELVRRDLVKGTEEIICSSMDVGLLNLAIRSDGMIFGLSITSDIYRVDAATGTVFFEVSTGLELRSITFGPGNVLYGKVDGNLYSIDLTTGSTEAKISYQVYIGLLAYDPAEGSIWGTTSLGGMVEIDTADFSWTIHDSVYNELLVTDIAFDIAGNLFFSTYDGEGSGRIILLDRATGNRTEMEVGNLHCIAFYNVLTEGKVMRIMPSSIDFGNTEQGVDSRELNVTLSNLGDENVTLNGLAEPDSIFTMMDTIALPREIQPGQNLTFGVVFRPKDTLLYLDTIFIETDVPGRTSIPLLLQGNGITLEAADSGLLYVLTDPYYQEVSLSTIHQDNGSLTHVTDIEKKYFRGVAIDKDGRIFVVDEAGSVFRVDAASGDLLPEIMTVGYYPYGIDFDTSGALLVFDSPFFYRIDLETGSISTILVNNYFAGVAVNPVDNSVYAMSTYGDLYTIDMTTGSHHFVGFSGEISEYIDMKFDFAGNLYAIRRFYDESIREYRCELRFVDEHTGQSSHLTFIDEFDLNSMAFYPSPQPGTHFSVMPRQLDFGASGIQQSADTLKALIFNRGTEDLTVNSVTSSSSSFSVASDPGVPAVLSSGGALIMEVLFSPGDCGRMESSLTANVNGNQETISLSGTSVLADCPIVVNSLEDKPDINPGDGICEDEDGFCTLRAAIEESNLIPGRQTIEFDIDGSGPFTIQPVDPLPEITDSVLIDGTSQDGYSGLPVIELAGDQAVIGEYGLVIMGGNTVVRGLVINRFVSHAIILQNIGNNTIENCFIGTDLAGTTAAGNGESGIFISSTGNIIGDASGLTRNIISGNNVGIHLAEGANENVITGNFIGLDVNGTNSLGNTSSGIWCGSSLNSIGNFHGGEGNVISGNFTGITINGNGVNSAIGNNICGNLIGLSSDGNTAIGNGAGVNIEGGARDNRVGGITSESRNVISGNTSNGLAIYGVDGLTVKNNAVWGNYIGVGSDGSSPMGNGEAGVFFDDAEDNSVGGPEAGHTNIIANNRKGVVVLSGSGNSILGNVIYNNTGMAIDLLDNGRSSNDSGDPDKGPNLLQNYPDIEYARIDEGGLLWIKYSMDTYSKNAFYPLVIQFFNSGLVPQGREMVAADTFTQDDLRYLVKTIEPGAAASLNLKLGDTLSATATDAEGNTSEFSDVVVIESSVGADGLSVSNHGLYVYPNPFSDEATIRFSNPAGDRVTLYVRDVTGKTVDIISDITGNQIIFKRGHLETGVYIFELRGTSFYRTSVMIK